MQFRLSPFRPFASHSGEPWSCPAPAEAVDGDTVECDLEHWPLYPLLLSLPTPALIVQGTEGQLLWANEHFCQLLELGPDPIESLSLTRFLDPTVWAMVRQALRQHHCLPNYELKLQTLTGQQRWGVLSLQLLTPPDGLAEHLTGPLVLGIVQETPCTRRLEQALQHHLSGSAIAGHLPLLIYQYPTDSPGAYWVSGALQAVLGPSPTADEQGLTCSLLDIVHPDDRQQVQTLHDQALTETGRYRLDYRILTPSGAMKWVQDQGQVTRQADQTPALQGIWLDVTGYKQAEQKSQLLHQLMQGLSNAPSFEAALGLILEQVCQTIGWDFGEVWVPNTKALALELLPTWYGRPELPQLKPFRQASLNYTFGWGMGLPGQVWQTQQPYWFADVSIETTFVRAPLAQEYGIKAGFGVPVLANHTVVAVLVFFMGRAHLRDSHLLQLVSTLARELGQSLQRKQRQESARQVEQALQESQRQLQRLIDALPGMFFRAENQPGWPLTYLSEGCKTLTGYSIDEFLHTPHQFYDHLIHPSDRAPVRQSIATALTNQTPYVVEYRIRTKTGARKWVWEKGHGVYQDGQATHIEGFITDITDRKAAEEALAAAEDKYRSIFENALEGIFQTTPNGQYLDANPALARIYGYDSPADLITNLTDIEHQLYVDESQRQAFQTLMQAQGVVVGFEAEVYRRDRSIIWITESAHAVTDDTGEVVYYEGLVMDITDQKRAEAELHQRAFYDPLTALPNRALFARRLTQALHRSQTDADYEFAVLFLDLDRFKVINDSLGHLVGDQLLVALARRLETCLRPQDTVARIGGDEFTILLDDVQALGQAQTVADRIEAALQQSFHLEEHEIFTSTSIGIVWSKPQTYLAGNLYLSAEDLLRDADTALYAAKARGKGCSQLFDPVMHQGAIEQFNQETELHRALEADELRVYYQPIYQLQTQQLYGFEAQLYWQHPQDGLLAVADFLSLADETHLSIPLYRWFLARTCQDLQGWATRTDLLTPLAAHLKFHLHCFSHQILHTHWIDCLHQTCQTWGVDPCCFRLEVADGFWRQENRCLEQQLAQLEHHQLKLCIHDFGLGVTSFHVLHRHPLAALRLNASLIEPLEAHEHQRNILRIMTVLAHHLQMETLATGVISPTQRDYLRQLGCQYGQGELFAPPLSLQAAQALP